jgi:hypothetical protein
VPKRRPHQRSGITEKGAELLLMEYLWLQDGAVHSRKCDRAILAVSPAIEMEFDAVCRDEE